MPKNKKPGRKICILGYAEETRDLVFNLSDDVEIWGINMAHAFTHANDSAGSLTLKTKAKPTNWFQMHPRNWASQKGEVTGFFGRPKEHLDFLQKFEGTVWLQATADDIPNGKRLPIEAIGKAAGRTFFTSTFAYQLGLAWYQHTQEQNPVDSIIVYGVNLSSMDEYIHQKSCVEYWIGRLEEAGVTLVIPEGSALMKGKLYAIGSGGDLSDHAMERLQFWKGKYMEAWANVTTGSSLKLDTQFWASELSKIADQFPEQFNDEIKKKIQETLDQRMKMITGLLDRTGAELNGALGMVKDNQHWLSITGGIDHRAPQLPDIRLPAQQLAQNFEMPESKTI